MNSAATIAAIATPPGKGAIAVVRVSGPAVPTLADRLVRTSAPLDARVATYATIIDERGEVLDRAIAIRFTAPHSYTGEEMLELQIHGSPVIARELMRALLRCGAQLAQPGEFTRRAFFNGKMDLHAAAAVADVIDAETRAAARAALANFDDALAVEVRAIRARIQTMLEELAGTIDFPDEVAEPPRGEFAARLVPIAARLARIAREGEIGQLVREGLNVAIVGPPNAGKSSLLNALLGTDRAIVSELPGTTRDTIEETIVVDDVPLRLVDTAGIRAHADRLEASGIERTNRALEKAGVALVVVDGSVEPADDVRALLERTRPMPRVVFFNKSDLGTAGVAPLADTQVIVGSVRDEDSLERIRRAIAHVGWNGERFDLTRPHVAALHEYEAVCDALAAVGRARRIVESGEPYDFAATELARAFSALGHVSEQGIAEEIIDGIFSRFCIGK